MARFVCSARVLDSLVRQTVGIDGAVAAFPFRSAQRTVRPLSTRARLAFHQTRISALDEVTNVPRELSTDSYVPIIDLPADSQSSQSTDLEAQLGWPAPAAHVQLQQALDESELLVDKSEVNRLIAEGLQKQDLPREEEQAFVTRGKDLDNHEQATWVFTDAICEQDAVSLVAQDGDHVLDEKQSEEKQGFDIPTGSRIVSRKARKVRRLEAKLEASKAELARTTVSMDEEVPRLRETQDLEQAGGRIRMDDEAREITSILHDVDVAAQTRKATLQRRAKAAADRKIRRAEEDAQAKELRRKEAEEARLKTVKSREPWQIQKKALKEKFGDQGWTPRKRISPDAIAGLRSLHASDPATYSTDKLADYFQISPEAVRRILKSKWQPNEDEAVERRARWERRGEKKWSEMVEQGIRPPKKWRDMGVGRVPKGETPSWRKGARPKGGERWIEHRSPEDLFARAAVHSAQSQTQRVPISDRIL
ncbi:hypothetical protein C1H76_7291 [Elsinoe australis]|uniref:Required for respiratory growth protein 9, mitochondrial n=1 Tax=Elsinoe australis TaxID=40998 RepID=A0A4U7AUZ3_9PEZI|nr:hypothetical protein C1H76_7291 [Elsinoe australis]